MFSQPMRDGVISDPAVGGEHAASLHEREDKAGLIW